VVGSFLLFNYLISASNFPLISFYTSILPLSKFKIKSLTFNYMGFNIFTPIFKPLYSCFLRYTNTFFAFYLF